MIHFEAEYEDQRHSDVMVLLTTEKVRKSNRTETLVSHGINLTTGRSVVLPQQPIGDFGGSVVFDRDVGEWFLK